MDYRKMMKISKTFYSTAAVIFFCILLILFRIFFGSAPSTHPEANNFIMHYNSGEPFISMIFDPAKNDWLNYQARELSYVLDYLDSRFIMECIFLHHAHFYSISAFIFVLLSVIFIHRNLLKLYPEYAEKWYAAAVTLAYAALNLHNTAFFRSAKPAVTFLVMLIFFEVLKILKFPEKYQSCKSHILSASILLLLPLFDRIGFFAAAVCAAGGGIMLLLSSSIWRDKPLAEKQKKPLMIFTVSAQISLLFSLMYNFYIAPYLVKYLHGYTPSFQYQRIPFNNWSAVGDTVVYVLKNAGALFTPFDGLAAVCAGVLIIVSVVYYAVKKAGSDHNIRLCGLGFSGIMLAVLICNLLMILRHPVILELPLHCGYFQVFSSLLMLFIVILFFECRNFSLQILFTVCVIVSNCWWQISGDFRNNLVFHRESTVKTVELLNNPSQKIEVILPSSSRELILFSREKMKN